MNKLLVILGAFEPELKYFREHFNASNCVKVFPSGIGSASAAARLASIISSLRREYNEVELSVLFVGSAGVVDSGVSLFSLVSATEVRLADSAVASGLAHFPSALPTEFCADPLLSSRLTPSLAGKCYREAVYSTTSVTLDVLLGETYARQTKARFENLELFGIAEACAASGVSWASCSVVTNHVGPRGHEEWQANFQRAAKVSAEVLIPQLDKVVGS
ncbi:MAG: hypothetical protein IT291_08760 [Deltaproteobacteria bacterium]|nr:hypothetical protein [Deltaproteobacteria bacterium]